MCAFKDITSFLLISATQLKPDEGTPELSEGRVRVRLETDGSVHDVSEYEVEKVDQTRSVLLVLLLSKSCKSLHINLSFVSNANLSTTLSLRNKPDENFI